MPIAYATVEAIKDALADSVGSSTTKYDNELRRCANQASRLIDRLTGRTFWPDYATRYPPSDGGASLYVDGDLLEVDSVSMSSDDGLTYTELETTDYLSIGGPRLRYDATPIYRLDINQNTDSDYSYWYTGQQSIKLVGWWGWHDDYANCWENSQDTVENDPLTAAGTSITVNDADGADLWGLTPRFQAGQLLKIESEFIMVTAVTAASTNTLTVIRGQCGTTAAAHVVNKAIYIYRPPEIVKEAVIASAVRAFKRAQAAYQDAGGFVELGQLMYVKEIAPEVKAVLYDAGLRRVTV